MEFSRILVRATNWVGDAVMSLPALQAIRKRFPDAHIAVLARPWVADLYKRQKFADRVILHTAGKGAGDWRGKWRLSQILRAGHFDAAILLQNAFEAALIARLAGIPRRIGYDRDGRGFLLTHAIPVPRPGEIRLHESYYYLEMLRRAGILKEIPEVKQIRLEDTDTARQAGGERLAAAGLRGPVVGVSPGAAFGSAKQWYPERFAEAATRVAAAHGAGVAVFGSAGEKALCEQVAGQISGTGRPARNFAGETSLSEFMEMAAACLVMLTNDSGAMHIAAALGVPTVAVFGPTDHTATCPLSPLARIVREPVDCSPCKLRECPTDHRCMERVSVERVAKVALELLK